jgi:integrase
MRGKHGRIRTVPMPTWVKVANRRLDGRCGGTDGHVFRPVNRGDGVSGDQLSEKVVWQILREYAQAAGVPDIAPHDARRYAESLRHIRFCR